MPKLIDIKGQRFGRLVVVERVKNKWKNHGSYWLCKCDCGKEKIVESHNLRNGSTKSCGCLNDEKRGQSNKTHGQSHRERLYAVWCSMRARCDRPTAEPFERYGGRGISVCDEWRDYAVFREWAYSHGYVENVRGVYCSIERIDNDGNYEPDNCKFVTAKEQANNRRSCRLFTIDGVTKNATEWASEYGMEARLVLRRVESGWDIIEALTVKPIIGRNQTWRKTN